MMHRNFIAVPGARGFIAGVIGAVVTWCGLFAAQATPAVTMDVVTGDVLFQQDATQRWYPASTTKLMTVYVALAAVRDQKIAMETPLVYSARARAMPPSKMGFAVGTQVTLENALRMLMVRSANDIAVTVAEGVSGSVEAFADDMNAAAAEIGLHESHFVNPNGLPSPEHVSSARDMALIARALYTTFPQYASLFNIGALSMGAEIITNHNNLLGRYPDADGMKTGFTCPAGFNVVASAYRDGRRIVVVVMGAPSVATRTAKVAALFDRAFAGVDRPIASAIAMPSAGGSAPDMRNAICRARSNLVAQFNAEVTQLDAPLYPAPNSVGLSALRPEHNLLFTTQTALAGGPTALRINSMPRPVYDPVPVHIGAEPGYQGVVAQARAPHSPIGTEPAPAAAEAYASTQPTGPIQGVGVAPLAPDPNALPLRGRRTRLARGGHHGRAIALKAAAEAPKTKVLAAAEGDDAGASKLPPAAKGTARKSSRKKVASAEAKKPSGDHPVKPATKPPAKKTNADDAQ